MEQKTCLVVYIGNGFSVGESAHNGMYSYTTDMRDSKENHKEFLYKPLTEQGYKVDTALVTNKHKFYDGFKKEYDAIDIEYDDITPEDENKLLEYYQIKVPQGWGPGSFRSGGRFLKLKQKMPEYDVYVFIRTDAILKKSISELSVDYEKINYLWPETDYHFYENFILNKTDNKNINGFWYDCEWFWRTYNRVNGNILNIVSKKYITVFLNYFWLEHLSLHLMIKDLSPTITVENDVNLMCGNEIPYVSDVRVCENPVYYFSKKIIS
jgi:hypothetical protein